MSILYVIAATQFEPNKKQKLLMNLLNIFFKNNIRILINKDFNKKFKNKYIYSPTDMEDFLFDFSRYASSLKYITNSNSVILGFNDTLGNGRKLNLFLYIFIFLSIFLILFDFYNFACPIDSDKYKEWISPYFFIGRFNIVKKLNWLDSETAKKELNENELNQLDYWIKNKWRQSKKSSKKQREIKLKTLFLERNLINSIPNNKLTIFKYNKKSFWRIMNSIIPI